jgi:hypothetical protein
MRKFNFQFSRLLGRRMVLAQTTGGVEMDSPAQK